MYPPAIIFYITFYFSITGGIRTKEARNRCIIILTTLGSLVLDIGIGYLFEKAIETIPVFSNYSSF